MRFILSLSKGVPPRRCDRRDPVTARATAPVAVIGSGIAGRRRLPAPVPSWALCRSGSRPAPREPPTPATSPVSTWRRRPGPLLAKLGVLDLLAGAGAPAGQRPALGLGRGAPRRAQRHRPPGGPGHGARPPGLRARLGSAGRGRRRPPHRGAAGGGRERRGALALCAGGADIAAGFLLDASGRAAVVARSRPGARADRLAALWAFLEQDPASPVVPTRATLIRSAPNGWWYAALLADGRLALNWYSDPDLLPLEATRGTAALAALLAESRHVARWIDEAGFRLAVPRLASAGTTWLAPAAGEAQGAGWAAVGDAAAAFDPLSSHGMTTALWTAIAAAETAVASAAGDPAPLGRYAAAVTAGVRGLPGRPQPRLYAAEARFAEHPFWRRRTAAHGSAAVEGSAPGSGCPNNPDP